MVSAAELGGRLNEIMVEKMRLLMSDVCGKDCDTATIISGCKALWDNGDSITSCLFEHFSKLSPESRRAIIRASNVILSIGKVDAGRQRDFLLYASRALVVPDDEFSKNTGMEVVD